MVLQVHRIIGYLKLEGIHENHLQDYLKLNHDLGASSRCFWNSWQACSVTTPLESLFQSPGIFWVESLFPTPHLNIPLQLDCISMGPTAGHQRDQHLACTALPLESADCDEVTPQPPFLQDEQAKWPQLLLISLVLKAFQHLHHPPWNTV